MAALEARILLAARTLFFSHGYGATSMASIARMARVSKVTLYARFPNRATLFRAIVAKQVESWDTGPRHIEMGDFPTLEAAMWACGNIALRSGLADDRVHIERLMIAESTRFPELGKIAQQRMARGTRFIARYIRAFAEHDKAPCRKPDAAAEMFLMTLLGWVNHVIARNRPVSAKVRNAWLTRAVQTFVAGRSTW